MGENMNKQELIHQIKIWLKEAAEKIRAVQIKTLKVDQKPIEKIWLPIWIVKSKLF